MTPAERKQKDIAEKGMNEEVHGFANSMVEPIAWPRVQAPYLQNGSGPKAFPPQALNKKNDIAEKGMN